MCLNDNCLQEIAWWQADLFDHGLLTKSLTVPKPTQVIFTDSSGHGYGSVWNKRMLQGLFSDAQRSLSITTKELLTILYTLQVYAPELQHEIVHLKSDNMVALFCIRQQGSRDVLHDGITCKIFDQADKYQFQLQVSYVKTEHNISDQLSHKFDCFPPIVNGPYFSRCLIVSY